MNGFIQFSILIICSSTKLLAQDTIFFNADWKEISAKSKAAFFRPPPLKLAKDKYRVKDYYISGQLQMDAECADKKGRVRDGYCTLYYESGKKEEEGSYANDIENGVWVCYYESGKKQSEGSYKNGYTHGLWNYYDSLGNMTSYSTYQEGVYHGEVVSFYKNGVMQRWEMYADGVLQNGKCFTNDGRDTIYFIDRTYPRFPGGDEQYTPYVLNDLSFRAFKKAYPDIHGTVLIQAFFDEKGKIYNAEFSNRVHPVADEVAMHIILHMPNWLPALDSSGSPVKTDRQLDIKF